MNLKLLEKDSVQQRDYFNIISRIMKNNIFDISDITHQLIDSEDFKDLATYKNTRIERIVSRGHITSDEWLEQSHFEWVTVIQGEACVIFDNTDTFVLKEGDYLSIPPNQKHRVTYTSSNPECIWLAIHIH